MKNQPSIWLASRAMRRLGKRKIKGTETAQCSAVWELNKAIIIMLNNFVSQQYLLSALHFGTNSLND